MNLQPNLEKQKAKSKKKHQKHAGLFKKHDCNNKTQLLNNQLANFSPVASYLF